MKVKIISHRKFLKYINKLHVDITKCLTSNKLRIDYVVPILRSGAIPAVYLSQRLVAVKFAPIQVKWLTEKKRESELVILLNSLKMIEHHSPTLLVVDANYGSGKSAECALSEIRKTIPNAKILFVVIGKDINSDMPMKTYKNFFAFEYQQNKLKDKPSIVFPWETLELETNHPDDLRENIFFDDMAVF